MRSLVSLALAGALALSALVPTALTPPGAGGGANP